MVRSTRRHRFDCGDKEIRKLTFFRNDKSVKFATEIAKRLGSSDNKLICVNGQNVRLKSTYVRIEAAQVVLST